MSADDTLGPARAVCINLEQGEARDAAENTVRLDRAAVMWLDGRLRQMYRAETEEPVPEAMLDLVRRLTGRDGS